MGWEYTGLPGPGDLLAGAGLITEEEKREGDKLAEEISEDTLTGTPPAISPIGLGGPITFPRIGAGVIGFLGSRRQPTGESGSPTELVDKAVEGTSEIVVPVLKRGSDWANDNTPEDPGNTGLKIKAIIGVILLIVVGYILMPIFGIIENLTE